MRIELDQLLRFKDADHWIITDNGCVYFFKEWDDKHNVLEIVERYDAEGYMMLLNEYDAGERYWSLFEEFGDEEEPWLKAISEHMPLSDEYHYLQEIYKEYGPKRKLALSIGVLGLQGAIRSSILVGEMDYSEIMELPKTFAEYNKMMDEAMDFVRQLNEMDNEVDS